MDPRGKHGDGFLSGLECLSAAQEHSITCFEIYVSLFDGPGAILGAGDVNQDSDGLILGPGDRPDRFHCLRMFIQSSVREVESGYGHSRLYQGLDSFDGFNCRTQSADDFRLECLGLGKGSHDIILSG